MTAAVMLTAAGGSAAWRRTAEAVLARDRYVCRMLRDGHRCGAPATTCNHRLSRALGGTDRMENLEAACVPCNMAAGGRLRAGDADGILARHNVVVGLVEVLDRYGVPADAGRRVATATLNAHTGHPWRTADIVLACRFRAARGPLTRI